MNDYNVNYFVKNTMPIIFSFSLKSLKDKKILWDKIKAAIKGEILLTGEKRNGKVHKQ